MIPHLLVSLLSPQSPPLLLSATHTHTQAFPLIAPPDFSALHPPDDPWGPGPQGIRGTSALATASWTMHLLGHGGPCFSHRWRLALGTPSLPRGGESSPLPAGVPTTSRGPVGEGGGREDADKIKGMKWKVFSRAFLCGGSKASTSTMGHSGSEIRCSVLEGDTGLGSSAPRNRVS